MKINITNEAGKLLKKKGHPVTILLDTLSGCCGGGTDLILQIHLGSPENLSDYERDIIGDITVFIDKRIDTESKIEISSGNHLWLKKLAVNFI